MTLHPTPHRLVSGASSLPSASSGSPRKVRLVPRAPHPLRLVAAGAPSSQAASPALAPLALRHQPQPPLFQKLRAPPPASCSCLTSCLRPPRTPVATRQESASGTSFVSSPSHARAATSGRYGVKRCPRCGLCSFVVALLASAPPLRERLTPRPPAAKSAHRFCFRKIR